MSEQEKPGPEGQVLHWQRSGTGYPSALEVAEMVRDIGRWLERQSPTWGIHPGSGRGKALKYRSPEEWRFRQTHPNEREVPYPLHPSNGLYALGVFLYQLLTRRFPFEATEGEDAVKAILHEAPVPPRRHNPRVPPPLDALCLRLLEKTPEQRVPSLAAMCAELDGMVARADDTWRVPLFTPRKRPRLPPWAGWAVALVLLIAMAGVTAWLHSTRSTPEGPRPEAAQVAPPPAEEEPLPREEEGSALVHVRPRAPLGEEPAPEECPKGAIETMERLRILLVPYAAAFPGEDLPGEGEVSLTLTEPAGKLPYFTVLRGRLHATPGRIYVHLTRARSPSGEEHPICMELREGRTRGARWERGSTPEDILVQQHQQVWLVERFE